MRLSAERIEQINTEIDAVIGQYLDLSASRLAEMFKVNMGAKNAFSTLTRKIIENSGSNVLDCLLTDEDFSFKTVRLDKYGRLKESMSLPVFKYCDICKETWETSELRDYFYKKVFAFIVLRVDGAELYLSKIVLWQMPETVLENGVRKAWQRMYDLLGAGKIVKYIDDNGRYFTYFPSLTENPYIHVRPHAKNRQDTYPLPITDKLTGLVRYPKHSFWLNNSYILKIITRVTD